MSAVDYSWARFRGADLKAKGIVAAGRYINGAGKAISKTELATLLFAGIVVWLVFEISANDSAGGYSAGVANAQETNALLVALGLPTSTPVYFAVDSSVSPTSALAYFRGIASVRPGTTNGCYGEGALCKYLRGLGLVIFTWQSSSTSFPGNATTLPTTNIQQKAGGAPLTSTDLDILLTADVGQIPRPVAPSPIPPAPLPPPPVVNYPEDNMTKHGPIILPPLDGNGNGFTSIAGVPDVSKIVATTWSHPYPPTIGGYVPLPKAPAIDVDHNVIVIEGGVPNGVYGLTVWTVD